MSISGSIQEVTVDGRIFAVPTDNASTTDKGGFTNDIQANGNSGSRTIKTRKPWSVTGLALVTPPGSDALDFLQSVANGDNVTLSFKYADDSVREGEGNITGDLALDSQAGTTAIEFKGPGELTLQ
jgi:hypothetical protein